ncbi:MAG: alpha-amylase family glycosyl hydrolase [Chloroflexota bacterium]
MRRPAAIAACLLAVLAAPGSSFAAGPAASPAPELTPWAPDGKVQQGALQHDSRDDRYRTPVGPVPAATTVLLRLRAAAGDLSGADVRLTDRATGESRAVPMAVVATDPTGSDHGYDWWQAAIDTTAPAVLDYSIVARDGSSVRYLTDDAALDGGAGTILREAPDGGGWQLTVYDPAFTTPAWAAGAVAYQIFPDRFANGDPTNDPSPDATPAPSGPERFRSGEVYGNPVLPKAWTDLPEGYCRAYKELTTPCGEDAFGRDFFGGDLAGITQHLDTLADLGVTLIYLNPIFAAPSNHRYDTQDYLAVDPDLGTSQDLADLLAAAKDRGIRVILDGVFNHVSSDSPWFDRQGRFPEVGACESADSPFRSWFTFRAPGPGEPAACAPSTPGGDDTYYNGWFGFDTIPEVQEVPAFTDLVTGPDGVVRHWLQAGTSGWRLDVSDSLSHPFQAQIRDAAKAQDPDSLIIAEQWGDSTPWLLGDQADSTMDYRFRRAVIALVNGDTPDPDGSLTALTPSGFAAAMDAVQEDYPGPAYNALLHLVDSHDTARILWTLTPGADNESAKTDPAAAAAGRAKLATVATIQLTFPGIASIYYGDEVGLSGFDDPDDRRAYPWGAEDTTIRDHYRTLARARADHVALREGSMEFLVADDASRALAYLRRTPEEAAVTVVNLGAKAQTIAIPVADRLPDGAVLADLFDGSTATVTDGVLSVDVEPGAARVLITQPGTDLAAPAAPGAATATAGTSRVDLSWAAVPDAASYRVLRSDVPGGGYTTIATTTDPAFTDTTVRNGAPAFYVIQALDAAGNVSPRSPETRADPAFVLTDLRLDAPAQLTATVSAVDPGPSVPVAVSVAEAPAGLGSGLRVEVGAGPVGSDPATDPDWTWLPATLTAEDGTAATFTGNVPATRAGASDVAARASVDGGATWTVADRTGSADGYAPADAAHLDAVPSADTTPPPAPGAPVLQDVAGDHVQLSWSPVVADDLYAYRVLRDDGAGGPLAPIATSTRTQYTDASVEAGATYRYAIEAVDTSLNASEPSPPLEVKAEKRIVQVTFTVSLPPQTLPGETIYIAGDFRAGTRPRPR